LLGRVFLSGEPTPRQDIGTKPKKNIRTKPLQNKREVSVPDSIFNRPVVMKSHQLLAWLDAEEQVEGASRVALEVCGPVITKVAAPNAFHGRGSLSLQCQLEVLQAIANDSVIPVIRFPV
jgi:hypothetical protein